MKTVNFKGYELESEIQEIYELKIKEEELNISFDFTTYMKDIQMSSYSLKLEEISKKLKSDDMTDWHDINKCIAKDEIKKILEISNEIINDSDLFVVVGIGGSYLGAQMVIDSLRNYSVDNKPEIIFVGTGLSSDELYVAINKINKAKSVYINVISKSGSSFETSVTFDKILKIMSEKYNDSDLKKRIIVTTDKNKGLLLQLANEDGYRKFAVPDKIGGRFSVLTPVGLLPIAVAGFDIDKLLLGASKCDEKIAFSYACVRDLMEKNDKYIELFTFYEKKFISLGEWLKQLFAETQGKNGKGLWPDYAVYTRDLHSIGQYVQNGKSINGNRIMFETAIDVGCKNEVDSDNGISFDELNKIASYKTPLAHYEGGVYTNIIKVGKINEETLGYLIHFFEIAAATGAYLLEVDPFDQPGVSIYKKLINEGLEELLEKGEKNV